MASPDSENRQPQEPLLTTRPRTASEAARGGNVFANLLPGPLGSGVLIVDGGSRVRELTSRARQLLGLPPDAASLPTLADLPAAVQAAVTEALASGQASGGRVIELKAAGGGAQTLCVSAEPLDPARADSGVVLVLNDLGPVCQLEERLEQHDRLANIGTLAAAMAHEIRNALVAGKTFVDLLLEKHKDAELAGLVQREMGRIDGIVGRMLKFGGPARPELGQVRLHDVLEHSLRLVQPRLEDNQVALTRSFQAGTDTVKGDERQLQQAFVNLLLNALDAMGPNGSLSVATELVPPERADGRAQVQVAIKDNGPGIPPEQIGRLFEPFFTTKPNGTGLGLSITRRIILDHQGDIRVESRPGQGTAFNILLPAAA